MVGGGGLGGQMEPTQQYCSTFIVLPAQWKLPLRQDDVDNTAQMLWSDPDKTTHEHTDTIDSGR